MRINELTAVLTPKVLLVPYSEHHVPEYHQWMKDEELQKATASEPLDLDAEYDMQRSWRLDRDKLTFIACLPPDRDLGGRENESVVITGVKDDLPERMIGDVNLFLSEDDDEDDDEEGRNHVANQLIGEVEIMIARKELQGKGYGNAVLTAFLWYIVTNLDAILCEYVASCAKGTQMSLKYLRVKIDAGNERSIKLFERAGFKKVTQKPNYFGELELRQAPSQGAHSYKSGTEEAPKLAVFRLDSSAYRES